MEEEVNLSSDVNEVEEKSDLDSDVDAVKEKSEVTLSFDLETIDQTLDNIQDVIEDHSLLMLDIQYGVCENDADIEYYLQNFNSKFEKFATKYGHQMTKIDLTIVGLPIGEIEIDTGLEYQINFISNFQFFTTLENLYISFKDFYNEGDDHVPGAILDRISIILPNPGGIISLSLCLGTTNFSKLIDHELGDFDTYLIQDFETHLLQLIQQMDSIQYIDITGNDLSTYFMDHLNICLQNLNSLRIVHLRYQSSNGDLAPIYTILKNTNITEFKYILSGPIELGAREIPTQEQLPNSYTRPYRNFENIITEMNQMIQISNLHRFPESKFPSINLNLKHAFEDDLGCGLHDMEHPDSFITHDFTTFLDCFTRMQLKSFTIKLPVAFEKMDMLTLNKKLIKTNALTILDVRDLNNKEIKIGQVTGSFQLFRNQYRTSFFQRGISKHMQLANLNDDNYHLIIESLPATKIQCFLKDLKLLYLLFQSASLQFNDKQALILKQIELNFITLIFRRLEILQRYLQQIPVNMITYYLRPLERRNLLIGFGGGAYTQLFRNFLNESQSTASASAFGL